MDGNELPLPKTLPSRLNSKNSYPSMTSMKQKINRLRGKKLSNVFRTKKKPCYLLNLPPELRLKIFKLALSDFPNHTRITLDDLPNLVRLFATHSSKKFKQEVQEAFEYWIPKTNYRLFCAPYHWGQKLEFEKDIFKETITRIEKISFAYTLFVYSYIQQDREARLLTFFACPHLTNIKHVAITIQSGDSTLTTPIPERVKGIIQECETKFPKLQTVDLKWKIWFRQGEGLEFADAYINVFRSPALWVFEGRIIPEESASIVPRGRFLRFIKLEALVVILRYRMNASSIVQDTEAD